MVHDKVVSSFSKSIFGIKIQHGVPRTSKANPVLSGEAFSFIFAGIEKLGCIYPIIEYNEEEGVLLMNINTNSMVSITEANQNFSKVARLVDEHGIAVILKNNVPRYIIMEFSEYKAEQITADEDVKTVAGRLIAKHREAFRELAE